jgi:hypothetical protein
MATEISITTGGLSAKRTFNDDTAAQKILLNYAASIEAQGTAQQKLQAVVDRIVSDIQNGARGYQFSVERDALNASIAEENRLK